MKIRILCFLLAVLSLTACGASVEENASAFQAEKSASEPETSDQHTRDLRPYGDWTFAPEPYLVSGCQTMRHYFPGLRVDPPRRLGSVFRRCFLLRKYRRSAFVKDFLIWKQVPGDEAWAIANRYYSLAIEYSSPDGTRCFRQESNYPQFCSKYLDRYRWGTFYDAAALPEQPSPYEAPIMIQAAELNSICENQLCADMNDWKSCEALSLKEHTQYQNQWLTEMGVQERRWNADSEKGHGGSSRTDAL